ncbi:putative MFS family arabinose efflux permease [Aeribacillus composti]|uniref:MFS transporter n=1 Tax=Aeribacillus composti TaxID=1868734 RepID=UPI00119AC667|nr:MFS transporter [Aeribacillus composti]TVZ76680.1 putative MFS family arabinose efflux permease [Aeribacillus composti]
MNVQKINIAGKKDHIIFLTVIFCFWFSIYIYVPIFGVYLEHLQFDYSLVGIIFGSYGITQILIRLPLGVLSDYLGQMRKGMLIAGFFMAFASGILFLFFQSFIPIFIARLLSGITASMWVMATTLYAQYFTESQSSKAMGILQFMTVVSQFISMAISGKIVEWFGWEMPFLIGTVMALIGLILSFRIKEIGDKVNLIDFKYMSQLKYVLGIKPLWGISALSLAGHGILFMTIFGFTPVYVSKIGFSESVFFWVVTSFFIPHAAASLLLAYFPVRKQKQLLLLSFILSGLFHLLLPLSNSILWICFMHIFIGFWLGFIFPLLLAMVIQSCQEAYRTTAMGFYQSFYAIGIFTGPMLAGFIADHIGFYEVFLATGLFAFAAAFLSLFIPSSRMERKAERISS